MNFSSILKEISTRLFDISTTDGSIISIGTILELFGDVIRKPEDAFGYGLLVSGVVDIVSDGAMGDHLNISLGVATVNEFTDQIIFGECESVLIPLDLVLDGVYADFADWAALEMHHALLRVTLVLLKGETFKGTLVRVSP